MTATPFRTDSIFLAKDVYKALRLVARAKEVSCTDELANTIVTEWLIANHPDVLAFVSEHYEAGETFAKELHQKLKPTIT